MMLEDEVVMHPEDEPRYSEREVSELAGNVNALEERLAMFEDLAESVALWKRTIKDGDLDAAVVISDKIMTKLVALGYDVGV